MKDWTQDSLYGRPWRNVPVQVPSNLYRSSPELDLLYTCQDTKWVQQGKIMALIFSFVYVSTNFLSVMIETRPIKHLPTYKVGVIRQDRADIFLSVCRRTFYRSGTRLELLYLCQNIK